MVRARWCALRTTERSAAAAATTRWVGDALLAKAVREGEHHGAQVYERSPLALLRILLPLLKTFAAELDDARLTSRASG